ncbi:MAG TPA: 2OG-Fe(II) oxygenase [Methylomirabilota bacterium]|nr:2OG-Fe(II) oxygenase [Methylomirabilota bacterium]
MKTPEDLARRCAGLAWDDLAASLDARGYATTGPLLEAADCAALVDLYADEARFRSRVDMARFRFGEGEYKYFAAPLPEPVATLRHALYPPLAPVANRWAERLGARERFPADHAGLARLCARHGQTRPTPLLLRYGKGGYNCLHQDIYGKVAFPLQLTILLSEPERDFTGGEFVLVEQRPRAQSAAHVVPLAPGEAVIFTTRYRPARGARSWYRVALRHGVSEIRSGERYTLGVIFHDAE